MKINYDCLRELLLVLEKNLQFSDDLEYPTISFKKVCEFMPDYSKADIAYSTMILNEAGLIKANIMKADNRFYDCIYSRLTYTGHKFLENVRGKKVWDKIKSVVGKIGGASIETISSIALEIIMKMVDSQL